MCFTKLLENEAACFTLLPNLKVTQQNPRTCQQERIFMNMHKELVTNFQSKIELKGRKLGLDNLEGLLTSKSKRRKERYLLRRVA